MYLINLERNPLTDIHISNEGFAEKPDTTTIASAFRDIASATETCSLEELAKALEQGHALTVSLFKDGHRKSDHWLKQRIFCVDHDNGTTIEELLERCGAMGFPLPNLVYETYSSTADKQKFHAVWILDSYITYRPLRDVVANAFAQMFPDSDVSFVKDADRIVYGTDKKVTIVNPVFTDLNRVFMNS